MQFITEVETGAARIVAEVAEQIVEGFASHVGAGFLREGLKGLLRPAGAVFVGVVSLRGEVACSSIAKVARFWRSKRSKRLRIPPVQCFSARVSAMASFLAASRYCSSRSW